MPFFRSLAVAVIVEDGEEEDTNQGVVINTSDSTEEGLVQTLDPGVISQVVILVEARHITNGTVRK